MGKIRKIRKKENDWCIVCGKETEYTKDTPKNQRFYYVEGVGQLCSSCYENIYGKMWARRRIK